MLGVISIVARIARTDDTVAVGRADSGETVLRRVRILVDLVSLLLSQAVAPASQREPERGDRQYAFHHE